MIDLKKDNENNSEGILVLKSVYTQLVIKSRLPIKGCTSFRINISSARYYKVRQKNRHCSLNVLHKIMYLASVRSLFQ
jgi:hypothetical protein